MLVTINDTSKNTLITYRCHFDFISYRQKQWISGIECKSNSQIQIRCITKIQVLKIPTQNTCFSCQIENVFCKYRTDEITVNTPRPGLLQWLNHTIVPVQCQGSNPEEYGEKSSDLSVDCFKMICSKSSDKLFDDQKQGKSEGLDSCDQPSNLTQIEFKSLIFQPVWPWYLMDDPPKTIGHLFYATLSFLHHL